MELTKEQVEAGAKALYGQTHSTVGAWERTKERDPALANFYRNAVRAVAPLVQMKLSQPTAEEAHYVASRMSMATMVEHQVESLLIAFVKLRNTNPDHRREKLAAMLGKISWSDMSVFDANRVAGEILAALDKEG